MSKAKSPAEKIESVNAQIEKAKEEIRQHQNRLKRLTQTAKVEERNARTHRLIERGAIVESMIDGADTLTNEQFKAIVKAALDSDAAIEMQIAAQEQAASPAPEKPAAAREQDVGKLAAKPENTAGREG